MCYYIISCKKYAILEFTKQKIKKFYFLIGKKANKIQIVVLLKKKHIMINFIRF